MAFPFWKMKSIIDSIRIETELVSAFDLNSNAVNRMWQVTDCQWYECCPRWPINFKFRIS